MPASSREPGPGGELYAFAPETLLRELPDFEILREVGKGSMGIVYEARRRRDGLRVALKILPPSLTLTQRALARFQREGELMTKVRHPAIVAALEHGRQGRLHYFVMEFVDGVTAEERVRVGPLPVRLVAEIGYQVAQALQAAHDHGVVHRDVKPGNLMIRDDGRVAITDFGLARETGTGSMTESGSIVGTPMYMAPEQVLGARDNIGTRADVYGLGATLYHLVTATPPFDGPTAQSVLKAVLEGEPMRPRKLRRELPPPLEAIIATAMAKEPARRYGSAQEMADDLGRFLRGERVTARRPGPAWRAYRAATQRPLLTAAIAILVVLALGVAWMFRQHRLERLLARVQEAESRIAQASSLRDDQLRPLSNEARHALLLEAVDIATQTIADDAGCAAAWLTRARAQHRLQRFPEALADLDTAEHLGGAPTPDILYLRIDTLRHLRGAGERARLRQDLTTLIRIDPGSFTHCLVAEYLLDMASDAAGADRAEILEHARLVLERVTALDARAAVARARLLELEGDLDAAEQAMAAARSSFSGDPLVHYHAAQLLRRLGNTEASRDEAELARLLDPLAGTVNAEPGTAGDQPLDIDEVQGFLEHVDGLLRALEPGRHE